MKLAFVIPWFGKDIPGGAESECRNTALHLKKSGADVEILTTCVRDFHSDWSVDHHPPGVSLEMDLPVRRFGVRRRDRETFDRINFRLMNIRPGPLRNGEEGGCASPIAPQEEALYIDESVNSPDLYRFIEEERKSYDFIIHIPYMFGTTYYGVMSSGDRAVILPCLHDESYAYMKIYGGMFGRAAGVLLHTEAEMRLAQRLYGIERTRAFLVGGGVETGWAGDGDRFRNKHNINNPYILYTGRRDRTKNVHILIEYFLRFRRRRRESGLKLVLLGGGERGLIPSDARDILELGFIPRQDKWDAYAGALVTCQPSLNESFSLSIMESWLAGKPVLVSEGCQVTKEHCIRSNGGLYFMDYWEFEGCLDLLLEDGSRREAMGRNGRSYVLANYTWERTVEKYLRALETLKRARG